MLMEAVRDMRRWVAPAAGVLALVVVSLWLRTTALHAGFWIDEGLSVGISSHPLGDIPTVLRQDGSPPLYYLLLGGWMQVFGDGQATTHVLSLAFALMTIPCGWWAGRTLVDARTGWYVALLAALNPFLTYYAQETRMYSLVVLLSLLVSALFVHVFVHGHRPYRVPAGLALAALVYTHNWGLFLAVGTVVALVPMWRQADDRRALLRDAAVVYGVTAVLYLPWIPSLLFQAAHTGAPWALRPSVTDVLGPISRIVGGSEVPFGLLLGVAAGLSALVRRRADAHTSSTVRFLVLLPLASLGLAWLASQVSPAYTARYFAVFLGPVLLLAGAGLAHAGRLGVVAVLVVTALWLDPMTGALKHKSDVRVVASDLRPHVRPGDLVVSIHPEQAPVLRYYLPPGLRYATALGVMPDPGVFDWRDALDRFKRARPAGTLDALVSTVPPGGRLILVLPIIRTADWRAPWTNLVRRRSGQWQRDADRDPDLRRLMPIPRFGSGHLPRGVRTVVYERVGATPVPRARTTGQATVRTVRDG